MAKDTNSVFFTGTVFNPDFKVYDSGNRKMSFSLAIDDSYKPKDKYWVKKTIFMPVQMWGKQAEAYQTLNKFDKIYIEGRIKQDEYTKEGADKPSRYTYIEPIKIKYLEDMTKSQTNNDAKAKEDAIKACRATGLPNQAYGLDIQRDNRGNPISDGVGFIVIDVESGLVYEDIPF